MAFKGFYSLAFVVMATTSVMSEPCERDYCYPGEESCWPSIEEGLAFAASLDGKAITPIDINYPNATVMINTRVTKYPYSVVMAESISDVIASVKFANKYKVKLSVRSSGHDYIGRSTGDGTLQINLIKMQDLKFNLNSTRHPAGEVKAQSGNPWIRVYGEVRTILTIFQPLTKVTVPRHSNETERQL